MKARTVLFFAMLALAIAFTSASALAQETPEGSLQLSHADADMPREEPLRIVTIHIVVDGDTPHNVQFSPDKIEHLITSASSEFTKEFRITFKITQFTFRVFTRGDDLTYVHGRLTKIVRDTGADIVVGFTSAVLKKCTEVNLPKEFFPLVSDCPPEQMNLKYLGYALDRVVILTEGPDMQFTILHELGHIFGAEHTKSFSVMNPFGDRTTFFDSENRTRILKHRMRKFR